MGIFTPLVTENITISEEPPTVVSGVGAMWVRESTAKSYVHDVQRNKWLSVSKSTLTYSYNGTVGNHYLSIGEVSYSEAGYVVHDNSTITSVSLTCREPADDLFYDIIINYNDVDTTILSFETVSLSYSNLVTNINVDTGSRLKVYARKAGTQAAKDPICLIGIQERYDV